MLTINKLENINKWIKRGGGEECQNNRGIHFCLILQVPFCRQGIFFLVVKQASFHSVGLPLHQFYFQIMMHVFYNNFYYLQCLFLENNIRTVTERSGLCNFIEVTLRHGCFSVNFLHIFRTAFPMNTSRGLRLLFENCVDSVLEFNLYMKKIRTLIKQNGSSRGQFETFFLTNFDSKYIEFA